MKPIVKSIPADDTEPFIHGRHYAKRECPISYAFGIFRETMLIGIVTFGTPLSSTLRDGICGKELSQHVLELNRLVCENTRNIASMLVGNALRMLPQPSIVVSFADIGQGHVGYVYQACNFIYTGLSAKRTDWKIKGLEHLHNTTVTDFARGVENRAEFMRDKYGDDFYLKERPRKHRYVFFCGNKRQKKMMFKALKYPVESYPKGTSARYDTAEQIVTQTSFL